MYIIIYTYVCIHIRIYKYRYLYSWHCSISYSSEETITISYYIPHLLFAQALPDRKSRIGIAPIGPRAVRLFAKAIS